MTLQNEDLSFGYTILMITSIVSFYI